MLRLLKQRGPKMLPRKATDWTFEAQTCSSKQKQRRLCFALINPIGPHWLMDRTKKCIPLNSYRERYIQQYIPYQV